MDELLPRERHGRAREVDAGRRQNDRTTVDFTFDGRAWRVVFTDEGHSSAPSSDAAFGRVQLSCDGERILEVGLIGSVMKEFDNWRFVRVEALRVGDWIKTVLDISAQIQAGRDRRRKSFGRDEKLESARNIEL